VHVRLGPNKVSFMGLLQPILDAVKLLSKSFFIRSYSNKFVYLGSPLGSLFLSLLLWMILPSFYKLSSYIFSIVCFMMICSFIVYMVLLSGWASNSKYSFIGCIRSIAQSISYEAVFSTLAIMVIYYYYTYSVSSISYIWTLFILYLFPIWFFCVLAESHRAPFDFSERESELVSGFNTEYMGGIFAFLFLREYITLLASSYLIMYVFFGGVFMSPFIGILLMLVISFIFILIRVSYCRFRYDLLMMSA